MQTGKDGAQYTMKLINYKKQVVSKVEVGHQQWEPVGGIASMGSEADRIISPEVAESKNSAGDVILKKLS